MTFPKCAITLYQNYDLFIDRGHILGSLFAEAIEHLGVHLIFSLLANVSIESEGAKKKYNHDLV